MSGKTYQSNQIISPKSMQDISRHCRLCLKPGATRNINEKISGTSNTILEKLRSLVNIQINPSDGLPDKICSFCFLQLKACLNFICKCEETDKNLRNIIKQLDLTKKLVKLASNCVIKELPTELIVKNSLITTEQNESYSGISNQELILKDSKIEIDNDSKDPQSKRNDFNHEVIVKNPDDDDFDDGYVDQTLNCLSIKTEKQKSERSQFKEKKRNPEIQCDVCGKIIRGNLREHMAKHTGEKKIACDYCGKRFAIKAHLIDHIKSHTNARQFSCDVCGARFNYRSNLTVHKLKHTGELPHVCKLCGKAFKASGSLQNHVRYHHTSVRNFPCTECKYAGITRSILRRHVRNVHTEREHVECNICGKVLSSMTSLMRHMMIHTGEKPFQCKHCPARFIQKSDMLKHEQSHGKAKKTKQSDSDEE